MAEEIAHEVQKDTGAKPAFAPDTWLNETMNAAKKIIDSLQTPEDDILSDFQRVLNPGKTDREIANNSAIIPLIVRFRLAPIATLEAIGQEDRRNYREMREIVLQRVIDDITQSIPANRQLTGEELLTAEKRLKDEISVKEHLLRQTMYSGSYYYNTLVYIFSLLEDQHLRIIAALAVLYYFARNTDIAAHATGQLTTEQKQDVFKDYEQIKCFLDEHQSEIKEKKYNYGGKAQFSNFFWDNLNLFLELNAPGDKAQPAKTPDNEFSPLTARAKARRAGFEDTAETISDIARAAEELPWIVAVSTDQINYPLDKPNSEIWNLIADTAHAGNGQLQLKIDTSKKGSKQQAVILCNIDFDDLPADVKITRQLTGFDKRVYIAAAALFNAGNKIITATQVFGIMGNRKKPNSEDTQKVNDSLTKMAAARVYIDNAQEVKYANGYKHFKYDASLLPFERISAYINGQLTESAIHLFREPPLISFARERSQVTTINRQLLESPVNKTSANLLIDDYLLERIGHMKSGKGKAPKKLLFTTIYSRCQITTSKQKQRAPDKIKRYLDHYKKCGWIKGYIEEADGITILL